MVSSINSLATNRTPHRNSLAAACCLRPTFPFPDFVQAWIDGLYKLWPGSRPDDPMQTDYKPYAAPLPTIAIGNIVPELSPAVGPASISIACV